jgi:hypothetical protein
VAEPDIAAFDLEGTLSSGVAWEGLRDYLQAHDEGKKFSRYVRKNIVRVMAFRLGLLRNERAFKEQWIVGLMRLFVGYTPQRFEEVAPGL